MMRMSTVAALGAVSICIAGAARAQDSGAVHNCVTSWHSVADGGWAVRWLSNPPTEAQEMDNTSDVTNWWAYAKPDVNPGQLPYRSDDECGQFLYTEIRNVSTTKVVVKGVWNPFLDNNKNVSGVSSQRVDNTQWPVVCGHTHLRTFVWYSTDDGEHYTYLGSQGQTTWQRLGRQGPVGSPTYCPLRSEVDPDVEAQGLDSTLYYWGPHEMDILSTGGSANTYMIATQIMTHGGSPGCGQFVCYHPVMNIFSSRPPYFSSPPNMTVP